MPPKSTNNLKKKYADENNSRRPPLGNIDINNSPKVVLENRKLSGNYEDNHLQKQYVYPNKHRVLKQSCSLEVASHFASNQYMVESQGISSNDATTKGSEE